MPGCFPDPAEKLLPLGGLGREVEISEPDHIIEVLKRLRRLR